MKLFIYAGGFKHDKNPIDTYLIYDNGADFLKVFSILQGWQHPVYLVQYPLLKDHKEAANLLRSWASAKDASRRFSLESALIFPLESMLGWTLHTVRIRKRRREFATFYTTKHLLRS